MGSGSENEVFQICPAFRVIKFRKIPLVDGFTMPDLKNMLGCVVGGFRFRKWRFSICPSFRFRTSTLSDVFPMSGLKKHAELRGWWVQVQKLTFFSLSIIRLRTRRLMGSPSQIGRNMLGCVVGFRFE